MPAIIIEEPEKASDSLVDIRHFILVRDFKFGLSTISFFYTSLIGKFSFIEPEVSCRIPESGIERALAGFFGNRRYSPHDFLRLYRLAWIAS